MAIDIGTSFNVLTPLPVDERLVLGKEQMKNINDDTMPEAYMATCTDDGQLYLYNKTNDIDAETGKFRLMEGGGSDIEQFIGTTAEWNDLPAADKEKYDGKEVIITDDYDGDAADTIELTSCTILGTLITAATLGSSLSNTLMLPFANSHLYNFTIAQLMIRGVGADDIQKWNVTPIPYVGYILTRTAPTVAMHGQYILSGTFTKK